MIRDRIGLIVWMTSLKQAKTLRRYGNVHYVSKRMKYAVLYCDQVRSETIADELMALPFVKSVQKSQRPFLKTSFRGKKWDKEKEKHYDDQLGL